MKLLITGAYGLLGRSLSRELSIKGYEVYMHSKSTGSLAGDLKDIAFNPQSGTTYTFVLSDSGKMIKASNASAQTYSIPTNASVAFPIGTQIHLIQAGSGQITVQAVTSGTTTILSTAATQNTPKTRVQYASVTCIKADTDEWYVIGDII